MKAAMVNFKRKNDCGIYWTDIHAKDNGLRLCIEDDDGNEVCLKDEQVGEIFDMIKPPLMG